jgi:hypothetical protein
MRTLFLGLSGFGLFWAYLGSVQVMGPIFWFWPAMQVPLW